MALNQSVTDAQILIVARLAAPNREIYLLHVAEPDPSFVGFDAGEGLARVVMDATPEADGRGEAPPPKQMVLYGLAGCTGMDTMEILQKMRLPVEGLEVTVSAEKRTDGTPGYAGVKVHYIVRGQDLPLDKVERAVRLSEEKYCTVGGAVITC